MPNEKALPVGYSVADAVAENDLLAPDIVTASDAYALRFAGEIGEYLLARQRQAVEALLDRIPAAPMRVLEVGGGHAQLTDTFAARGHAVTVQGSSAACFGRLAGVRQRHAERIATMMSSLWTIPVEDRTFDLVCSIRLLGHVESWRELLAEKCRLASRYVICEFTTPQGAQRLAGSFFTLKRTMEPGTRPFYTYGIDAVTGALATFGFQVTAIERQFVLPMALHRALASPTFSAGVEGVMARAGLTERLGTPVVLLAERMA